MDFSKNELAILVALLGKTTTNEKVKMVKECMFFDEGQSTEIFKEIYVKENDIGYKLYRRLADEYRKLR